MALADAAVCDEAAGDDVASAEMAAKVALEDAVDDVDVEAAAEVAACAAQTEPSCL
jgi:hypothetical protein